MSPQMQWIREFIISHTHIEHPNFIANHLQAMQMRKCNKHLSHCLFLLTIATTALRPPFLPLIEHAPHEQIPRVLWTCRSYTVLENCKHTKHKLFVAWTECFFYYLLITEHISCACSGLFSRRNNNQPFINERLKLRKECFKWGDNIEWGRSSVGDK